jgi:hypothetical protein
MMRTILGILACSLISHAQTSTTATGVYRFTTPQTPQGLQEATTIVRTVASVPQVSVDTSTATFTLSGPAEAVSFAEWVLARIDKAAGDNAVYEYRLPSGEVGRVIFAPGIETPPGVQELLTVLRTVADVRKIFTFTSNHAVVLSGPDWEIAFAEWIIDQLNQSMQQKPDATPREFTVGGPDFKGMGHGARLNFLSNRTSPRQMQELLTVLRAVGDVQKVFSYTASHALILRTGDSDLQRAEWMIQQLDLPAGPSAGAAMFTASSGDDVTRIFHLRNADPQWLQTSIPSMRSELKIGKIFATTAPANIVVRGTADQIAAVTMWLTSHSVLAE